jgi:hypothetical protein
MLAVSGTLYRLKANVLREVVADWCKVGHKIPDAQFGFYSGRDTAAHVYFEAPEACSPKGQA